MAAEHRRQPFKLQRHRRLRCPDYTLFVKSESLEGLVVAERLPSCGKPWTKRGRKKERKKTLSACLRDLVVSHGPLSTGLLCQQSEGLHICEVVSWFPTKFTVCTAHIVCGKYMRVHLTQNSVYVCVQGGGLRPTKGLIPQKSPTLVCGEKVAHWVRTHQ